MLIGATALIHKRCASFKKNGMKTNFEIKENYAVQLNRMHIDLHNNFDLIGHTKNVKNITVDFKQTKGDWVKNDEFKKLKFELKNVSFEYF